tara:strand:+ start:203 stop:361 length:159 start_codon:yes stop_codon:yes gene_type:complete
MKKIMSYVPFIGSLSITITVVFAFALSGSLGFLALVIPCTIATILTIELIER